MREEGYYYVKFGGKWQIAYWFPNLEWWECHFISELVYDKDFEQIDEKKIERG